MTLEEKEVSKGVFGGCEEWPDHIIIEGNNDGEHQKHFL